MLTHQRWTGKQKIVFLFKIENIWQSYRRTYRQTDLNFTYKKFYVINPEMFKDKHIFSYNFMLLIQKYLRTNIFSVTIFLAFNFIFESFSFTRISYSLFPCLLKITAYVIYQYNCYDIYIYSTFRLSLHLLCQKTPHWSSIYINSIMWKTLTNIDTMHEETKSNSSSGCF
jgi:hypothetical protein